MSFAKMPFKVDVAALCNQLDSHPELFDEYQDRRLAAGSPHAEMTDIWVRYNAPENRGAHFNDEHVAQWYPCVFAIPEAVRVAADVFEQVGGEVLGAVLITKLPAGGKIYPHIDSGWHAGFYDKYYVSVRNGSGAVFGFPDGEFEAKAGDVYQFDNSVEHWVNNDSDEERLSMIVRVRTFERSIREVAR